MPGVGIDLGTTNSCVAVCERGAVDVLVDDMGSRLVPSCVAVTSEGTKIGLAAREMRKFYPRETIYGVKRIIGREFADVAVQRDMKSWSFNVINDDGKPMIELPKSSKVATKLRPEDISGMVLSKMKSIAEATLGEVQHAVITVPAYFNDAQRKATMSAAKIAKLHVLRLLNEPTAAAIGYGVKRKIGTKRTVLVYDFGGGTFDVTLLTIEKTDFKVLGTDGDTCLGGDDLDRNLADHMAEEFNLMHDTDVKNDAIAMATLMEEAEKGKISLSRPKNMTQRIEIKSLKEGKDLDITIARATFESLNSEYFRKTFDIVDRLLTEKNISKREIDEVLLVGGSTRIPLIQEKMKEMFGEEKVLSSINADEAVAYGAAVYAAHLTGDTIPNVDGIRVSDVTPFSLGVQIIGGIVSRVIERNSEIPVKNTERFFTVYDNQTSVRVNVYEGERVRIQDNRLLGGFTVDEIPPMPAGEAKLDETFEVNANGILNVTAIETSVGRSGHICIREDRTGLTDREILESREIAEKFKKMDEELRAKVEARNELQSTALKMKRISVSGAVKQRCIDTLNWLKKDEDADEEDYRRRRKELEDSVKAKEQYRVPWYLRA